MENIVRIYLANLEETHLYYVYYALPLSVCLSPSLFHSLKKFLPSRTAEKRTHTHTKKKKKKKIGSRGRDYDKSPGESSAYFCQPRYGSLPWLRLITNGVTC